MEIVNRVKNILVAPKAEWATIEVEQDSHVKILTSYLLLLALIPAVGHFIGDGLIGRTVLGIHISGSVSWGIRQAITAYISMVGGVYLTAFVINLLAESFGSTKDFNKAFALVAYSYTPMCIAGIFYILPVLSILAFLAGLYGLYILYTGLKPMMKTPDEKQVVYFVVSLISVIVVTVILSAVFGAILLSSRIIGF